MRSDAPIPPRLLPPREAAERISVCLRTMRTLIARRAFPVVRVSPRRLGIREDDLAAYLARQREAR